ncbi:MAG TPA: BREX-3 system phosphatase PglZ [Alphaproteobacteria bacterium]|nr:BREX-3 system phosphatase PglZ [Alphaproteobacteria bacterium]
MNSWREMILNEFTPNVAKLTLVADPDGLLLEEGILEGIHERGFELIPFEDHVAFRYVYESKFRSRWDRGEHTDLVIVLRSAANELKNLPFDLLQAGRKLTFNLGDIFPNLSYPVVTGLDRADLDSLYLAQERHAPGQLGENATKEFVLRHVFEIAPELIKQPSDLLRVLLRRHYRNKRIPQMLDDRFIQILQQNDTFTSWPLAEIVPDRETFFAFLQERWPLFLDRFEDSSEHNLRENREPYGLQYPGPSDLPFDHQDVKVYIDNLFIEGMLQSVSHEKSAMLSKTWAGIGVITSPKEDRSRRLSKQIDRLRITIPGEDAKYNDWFLYARGWAELIVTINEEIADATVEEFSGLFEQVDTAFCTWLFRRYAGLINLPPSPPVMLHHLPRFLSHKLFSDKSSKVALIVVDGLSQDQWIVIRETLSSQQPDLHFRENAVFAWIPTITSVSRQSIFAGRPPIYFPNSISSTEKEPSLWSQFWVDNGLQPNEITYAKGLGDGNLSEITELLSHPKLRIAGLVIDKIDKIMHGMELGTAGMHNQVRQWAKQSYIASLLDLLLSQKFQVFLTSDHGNIEAEGYGRPAEGVVADLRGERVRTYPDAILRAEVKKHFPDAIEWLPAGLPDNYLALISPGRKAFVGIGKHIVGHGGISLEELIVPLVQIERRNK